MRAKILKGTITLPLIQGIKDIGETAYASCEQMFVALWRAYINKGTGGTISLPYWSERVNNMVVLNATLKTLSENGWITTNVDPLRNWGEASLVEAKLLQYVTVEELAAVRLNNRVTKYLLEAPKESAKRGATNTKVNGEVKFTGLTRHGFAATATTQFQFDVSTLKLYQEEVTQEVAKGILKMAEQYPMIGEDKASYIEVSKKVVNHYISHPNVYSANTRTSDPRGRNISGYLSKVGNPVGFKCMRALLVIPEQFRNLATSEGATAKFLFVAQEMGFKDGTREDKEVYGVKCYMENSLPNELAARMWVQRTYRDLDGYYGGPSPLLNIAKKRGVTGFSLLRELASPSYKWVVPIELDMSASVLGYIGLLLNHAPFLERCNIIGDTLGDAWSHPIITNRVQFKTIMRQCYGSTMTPEAMWEDMGIPYTPEEAKTFREELNEGELAPAAAFKDFLIRNCRMEPEMSLTVGDETFIVPCNKHHIVGEVTSAYDLYCSSSKTVKRILNTKTAKVPDLKSFRRYTVTGLIHNLDSQVMNSTCRAIMDQFNWAIDIHDAIIVCPEAATLAREVYANGATQDSPSLKWVHTNRKSILEKYFSSVGIALTPEALKAWDKVQQLVIPLREELQINTMVLK